jgi:hypothetical protein
MPDFSNVPEVFVSTADLAAVVSREAKLGRLRKIGSRLYTRNLTEKPEKLVLRNFGRSWRLICPAHSLRTAQLWKTGPPSTVQSSLSPITSAILRYLE